MSRGLQLEPEDYPDDYPNGYGDDPARKRGSGKGLLRGLLLAVGVIGGAGVLWAGAGVLRHSGGPATIPIIRADERPVKVLPVNAGGMEVPDQDMLVLNKATPVDPHNEQLLPPPETPLPRPVAVEPPAADAAPAPPPAAAPAAMAPAPAVAATAPVPAAVPAPVPVPVPAPARVKPPVVASTPVAAATVASAGKGYRLQIGAVRASDAARQEWERLRHAQPDLLGRLSANISRTDLGERGVYYRIVAGPIADGAEAERVCNTLKQRKVGCILVKP